MATFTHESVREMATKAEPWNEADAKGLRATSRALLARHDHGREFYGPEDEKLTRENCGACVLNGYGSHGTAPNYAGWLRVFIEAGRPVPALWLDTEMLDAQTWNPAYYSAILRSVATFGLVGNSAHDR